MYRPTAFEKGVFSIPDLTIGATKLVLPNGTVSHEKLLLIYSFIHCTYYEK